MEAGLIYSAQRDSSSERGAVRTSELMRSVNMNLRQLAGSLALSEPVAFFCECESTTCYSPIWMSRAAFDAAVERPGLLLLEGHEGHGLLAPERPAADAVRVQ